MYIQRTEFTAVAGQAGKLEGRWDRSINLWSQQPAFRSGTLLNSLGSPNKYVYLTRWDSREAFRSYVRSEEFLAALAADPVTGLSTPGERQPEAYDSVLDVTSAGNAAYVTLLDWTIDNRPDNIAAFESHRKEQYELRQKHVPGFVFSRLDRFLGATPPKYLTSIGFKTRAEQRAGNAGPELQAFLQAHPLNAYSSLPWVTEPYEVMVHVGA